MTAQKNNCAPNPAGVRDLQCFAYTWRTTSRYRGIASWLLLLVVVSATTGCKSGSRSGSGTRIAVVLKTLSNPYWVQVQQGIQAEAATRNVPVDIVVANGEDDIEGQQRLMEDLINKDYAAIGVAPNTPASLLQPIVAANRKGIYVVDIDESVDLAQLQAMGGSIVALIGTDDTGIGRMAGEFLGKSLGAAGGNIAMIEGKAGSATGDARRRGLEEALHGFPAIKIVASQPADWDRTKAVDVTANILQGNPTLKAIYAANDVMALGAAQAVASANKTGTVMVVGTDGSAEALQSIQRGELTATVAQDPKTVGVKALDALADVLQAKPPISSGTKPQIVSVEAHMVVKGQQAP